MSEPLKFVSGPISNMPILKTEPPVHEQEEPVVHRHEREWKGCGPKEPCQDRGIAFRQEHAQATLIPAVVTGSIDRLTLPLKSPGGNRYQGPKYHAVEAEFLLDQRRTTLCLSPGRDQQLPCR